MGQFDTGAILDGDRFDAGAIDVGSTDVGAAKDGAGACPSRAAVDPKRLYAHTLWFSRTDNTEFGGASDMFAQYVFLKAGVSTTVAPTTTSGNCVLHGPSGQLYASLRSAVDLDYGDITVTQGARYAVGTFSSGYYAYDGSNASGLQPGLDVTVATAGGAGGPTFSSKVTMPPTLLATEVHASKTISSGSDAVVSITPVAPLPCDVDLWVIVVDEAATREIDCAVPASSGTVTIPGALTAAFTAGTKLTVSVNIARHGSQLAGSIEHELFMGSEVLLSASAQ